MEKTLLIIHTRTYSFLCCFARSHNSFNIDPKTSRTSHRLIFCFYPGPVTRWQEEEESWQRGGFSIWTRDASVAGVPPIPCPVQCAQGGLKAPTPASSRGTHVTRHASLRGGRIIKSMVAPAPIISIVCHNHQMAHNNHTFTHANKLFYS